MKLTSFFFVPGILLLVFLLQAAGSPLILGNSKPPNCPYGKCFIDSCERICTCVSPEGNTRCERTTQYSMHCQQAAEDPCPLGPTYRSDNWPAHFLCYCNKDASQTYECFDLSKNKPADAQLLSRIRSS